MQEALLCLQNSSPWQAGGAAGGACCPGAREGAGWSQPAGRGWDENGSSRDAPSYWIPVKSHVPRTGSCSWDCAGRTGHSSRQGLSQEQAAHVPGQAEPRPPGRWRRWKRGTCAACPMGGAEAPWGCWAPRVPVCVSIFWEMSPCTVIPAAPHRCFLPGLVWLCLSA